MARSPFTLGLLQDAAAPTQAEALTITSERIRAAAGRGAQVIGLKELFNAPYFCKKLDAARFDLAEPVDGATITGMRALAQELAVVLVVPFYEKRAPGVYSNSAAIIDADGALLGIYRKMHIPHDPLFEEKYYFVPGETGPDLRHDPHPGIDGFRVWRTRYADIGVLICWDQWYPEGARITAMLGADLLFYPTAIGWHPGEKATFGETQVTMWRTAQRAHAIANGCFVAATNRVGFEPEAGTDGLEFFGHSFIYDPYGRPLAEAATDEA
ncbi:MAG: carbon-nitrogen hydrolase, partial [Gemmatimonadaceae bacterium]|nr:carbon-nitrogen hydrolase [Gemmatimonadaceae bacterium]